jgi:hypothetical protein
VVRSGPVGAAGEHFFDSIISLISLMCFVSGDGWVIDWITGISLSLEEAG